MCTLLHCLKLNILQKKCFKHQNFSSNVSRHFANIAKATDVCKPLTFQLTNLVDWKKCRKTRIYLQRSVPIQPKTRNMLPKFWPAAADGRSTALDELGWKSDPRLREGSRAPMRVRFYRWAAHSKGPSFTTSTKTTERGTDLRKKRKEIVYSSRFVRVAKELTREITKSFKNVNVLLLM